MSSWGIGPDPLQEQIANLKRELASKDIKCSNLESQLLKTNNDFYETRTASQEAQANLRREADRAQQLEKQLLQTKEDLENQRISRQNAEDALRIARDDIRSRDATTRDLQNTIQTLSSRETDSNSAFLDLQKEKEILEKRLRLLEANYQNVVSTATPGRPGARGARPRSSSLSDMKVTALERELGETHSALNDCRLKLEKAQERLRQAEDELVRADNEKAGVERRMKGELARMKELLDEKDEDIEQLREQAGGGGLGHDREQELIERIEEEEAKVAALEKLMKDTQDMKKMQDALDRAERRLKSEMEKVKKGEEAKHELARTRDSTQRELRDVRSQLQGLTQALEERDRRIVFLDGQERDLRSQLERTNEKLSSMEQMGRPGSTTFDEGLTHADQSFTIPIHSTPLSKDSSPPPPAYRSTSDDQNEREDRATTLITRLRQERDGLRRDLEFLELESKFTIQGLQSKLAAMTASVNVSTSETDAPDPGDLQRLEADVQKLQVQLAQVSAQRDLDRNSSNARFDRIATMATSSLVLVGHLSTQSEEHQVVFGRMDNELRRLQNGLQQARAQRDACIQDLKQATTYQDDLLARLAHNEDRVEEVTKERDHLSAELEQVNAAFSQCEAELTQVTQTLEEIASEHDSLLGHVGTLEADLAQAQEDIAEGEMRYNTLQEQQSMSSGDVTRALRQQIQELEARVERRTEQIGLHQHDIKRLEINLQLQEERIDEMTAELETNVTEKESMLQDCADAREARDQALQRVEELEDEIETLDAKARQAEERVREANERVQAMQERVEEVDGRLREADKRTLTTEEERTLEAATLISLWVESTSRSRMLVSRLHSPVSEDYTAHHELSVRLDQLTSNAHANSSRLDDALSLLQTANESLDRMACQARDATISLAVSQVELRSRTKCLHFQRTKRLHLEEQLEQVQRELSSCLDEMAALRTQLELSHSQHAQTIAPSGSPVFEVRLQLLQQENLEARTEKARLQELFDHSQEELRALTDELSTRVQTVQALEEELTTLRSQSTTEAAELQTRLAELAQKLSSVESSHAASWDQLSRSYQELEERYKHCLEESEGDKQRALDANAVKAAQVEEISVLQTRLDDRAQDLERLVREREQDEEHHRQTIDALNNAKVNLEVQLSVVTAAREDSAKELERLRHEVADKVKETEALQTRLDADCVARDEERKTTQSEQRLASERYRSLAETSDAIRRELETVQRQLSEANDVHEQLQNENAILEHRATELEAEIQRGISLRRHLESQLAESERESQRLKAELEHVQGERFQAIKAEKSAQMELTLQSSRYEQTVSSLRRQIETLQPSAQQEEIIVDLRDELQRMDDMLRAKTQEVEDNDDRFLELIKEKKKMNTKIENLTRKVQSLQSKLASAKVASSVPTAPPPAPVPSSSRPPSQTSSSPSVTGPANTSIPKKFIAVLNGTAQNHSTTPLSHPRTMSGPSSFAGPSPLPRPKTPDSKTMAPAVFRLKTPEHPRQPANPMPPVPPPSSQSTTLIGKKRSAPDDNDDSAPAQVFTADGAPFYPERDRSDLTPRVRKQTRIGAGFTPVRNIMARTLASPVRTAEAGMPADVTNSPTRASTAHLDPRGASKKGWLGKMKGGSSAASQSHSREAGGYGMSQSSVFERPRGL